MCWYFFWLFYLDSDFFHLASIPQTYQMIMIYFGHVLNAGLSGEQSQGAAVLMGILKESSETDCDLATKE